MAEDDTRQVPIAWVGLDEERVFTANQFVSQFVKDQFIVSFGMLVPPPILGDEEQRKKTIEEISHVSVQPITRVALTPRHMRELIGVLQENLERNIAPSGEE